MGKSSNIHQAHRLCETVQYNCNISDAHHASDYTLCIYLLKMREYFRWEKNYRFSDTLPQSEVTQWLTEREKLWDDLEDKDYLPLSIQNQEIDPFDAKTINQFLLPHGYVYSAGIGPKAATHFFMAELAHQEVHQGYSVLIANQECARDIAALPAMCINEKIFVRRESLKRMLWEILNEWRWRQAPGLLEKAFSYYDFETDLETALEKMCDVETQTLIMHEIGELKAGAEINRLHSGSLRWHDMLTSMPRSRAEISVRAIKDHLADTLYTLPKLIEQQRIPSLYFYLARLPPLHKQIFPALYQAAEKWQENNHLGELEKLIHLAQQHWLSTALAVLKLFEESADYVKIVALIESRKL